MTKNLWIVIGISGVTCGGKTSLSLALYNFLNLRKDSIIPNTKYKIGEVRLINQDEYFLPVDDERHTWVESLKHINWEILTALDMRKMLNDVSNIVKDDHVINFNYDQKQDSVNTTWLCNDSVTISFLLIEGFLIFNQIELLEICQLKYHIHLPYEKCVTRRNARVYDPPDVIGYFEMVVWPMYEKHLAEFKEREDIVKINGDLSTDRLLKYILNSIQMFLQ